MRTMFLLALLLPLCLAHPVDISGETKKVGAKADHDHNGTHSHAETHDNRGGKMFSNNEFDMEDITISGSVGGDDISIGHQVEINVNDHGQGIHTDELGSHDHDHDGHDHHVQGCPMDETIMSDCTCGGNSCAKGSVCASGSTCTSVCDPGPYELQADCFCKNTKGGGAPCAAEFICEDGICKSDDLEDFPCAFQDDLLTPPVLGSGKMSTHDTSGIFKWTASTVQYYYSQETTWDEDKKIIRGVMDNIGNNTCFQFEEGTKADLENKHSLEISIPNKLCTGGCGGTVDVESGNNDEDRLIFELFAHPTKHNESTATPLYDDEGNPVDCRSRGLILHELMHVLGVGHTQTRSDRDQYIEVLSSNISDMFKKQYMECENCTLYDSIPYDCESLMHFGTHHNGVEVMRPLDPTKCKLKKKSKYLRSLKVFATENDWKLLNIIGKCHVCAPGQVSMVCWCKDELCDEGKTCTTDGKCTETEKKRKRSTQTATVRGKIVLPEDSDFTFPSNSHVHVSCDHISNLHSTNLGSAVVDVSNKPSEGEISYELEAEFPNFAQISMSATINVGWNRDPDSNKWIRRGDFHNDVSHPLSVQDNSVYEKDIAVALYD